MRRVDGVESRSSRRLSGRRLGCAAAALAAAVSVAACGSSSAGPVGGSGSSSSSSSKKCTKQKPCTAYISENFAGNPIREQILKTMQLAQTHGELAGTVKVKVSSAGNTVQAQAQDIQNIASSRPDLLVILPSSQTGLDAAIQSACKAGVTVVAFDSPVNAPCAHNTGVDFPKEGLVLGTWLGEQAQGKSGTFLIDQGLPGIPFESEADAGFDKGIKQADPHANLVNFQGGLAPGPEKAAVANILPAHRRNLLGVAGITAAASIAAAVKESGLQPVPIVNLTGTNSDLQACLVAGQKCFIGATPATEGAYGLRLAVQLRGGASVPRNSVVPTGWLSNTGVVKAFPDVKAQPLVAGKTVFPNLPPSFTIPYTTSWLPITPQLVAGK